MRFPDNSYAKTVRSDTVRQKEKTKDLPRFRLVPTHLPTVATGNGQRLPPSGPRKLALVNKELFTDWSFRP